MKRTRALVGLLVAAGCASSQAWKPPAELDSGDVPEKLRPGYGNDQLHTWWPLTAAETAALGGLERAKGGETHALLALAVLASADARDDAGYARVAERVDRFLAEVKPAVDGAPDLWHRGYELHRAMHRAFFRGAGELGGYELNQARVTAIVSEGRYNCLSSAMLFAVLARAFGLPVRAVVLPTHVFIEIGTPGEKIIEVETTSATGFDWVHDDRFYREDAAQWSSSRGFRPVTLDEYRHRTIVEPYRLMALGMRNRHVGESEEDRMRLYEVAGLVDPDDVDGGKARVEAYVKEAHDLYELKASRTLVKLFDTVGPALSAIEAGTKDSSTRELVSWARWFHANALMIVGRPDEAMALMTAGLDHLDASWPDAEKLKTNYTGVLNDRLGDLVTKKDYPAAVKVFNEHREVCRAESVCAGNVGVLYANWSIDHQNAGDWQSARQVLQQCLADLPSDERCRESLKDLESRHRF